MTAAILRETSATRGLRILRAVPTAARTRPQIERVLQRQMGEQLTSNEIRGSELMLRVLGLVPPNFQLRPFYLKLLSEQVAGFYDPKERAFYTASWVNPGMQKMVAVHELTHALQDQHFGLAKFQQWPRGESDSQLAAAALIEGDAMQAMALYIRQRPAEALALLRSTMAAGGAGNSRQFEQAPRALREALTFPYEQGMQWVSKLYQRGGWRTVNNAYRQLPLSTEHILHVEKYFAREKPVPVKLPDLTSTLGTGWRRLDDDVNGELGLYLTLDQIVSDKPASQRAAAGWGGDRYAVYGGPGGAACVVMMTVWDSQQDAREFFEAYVQRSKARFVDVEVLEPTGPQPVASTESWATGDARVVVQRRGNRVLVIEAAPSPAHATSIAAALWKGPAK
jgi:hypothetical protein